MNKIRKMFFASTLLFNSILCNCNVKGMEDVYGVQNFPVVEVKRRHDVEILAPIVPVDPIEIKYIKLAKSSNSKVSYQDLEKNLGWTLLKRDFFGIEKEQITEGKKKYCFNSDNSSLDNSYAAFCIDCLSKVNFDELVVDNNKLPDSINYDELKFEEQLGFKILYLMLANMCIDWLIHNKKVSEKYDESRNNNDIDIHELIDSAKKLENLNSEYVSNYVKESLINGRKARLWRDCGPSFGYYESGILFDDNIFLSSDLGEIANITFPHFSCDYNEKNRAVTFRFFKKTKENIQPMMIVIREAYPGIIPDYEIFFYDEEGHENQLSGTWNWGKINEFKSKVNLLFTR